LIGDNTETIVKYLSLISLVAGSLILALPVLTLPVFAQSSGNGENLPYPAVPVGGEPLSYPGGPAYGAPGYVTFPIGGYAAMPSAGFPSANPPVVSPSSYLMLGAPAPQVTYGGAPGNYYPAPSPYPGAYTAPLPGYPAPTPYQAPDNAQPTAQQTPTGQTVASASPPVESFITSRPDRQEYGLKGGYYVSLDLIGSIAEVRDHTYTGGTSLEIRHDDDEVGGNSLAVGYDWRDSGLPIRTEIESGVRYRFDLDYRGTNNVGDVIGYKTNLATAFAMINGFYDFHMWENWTPYLGAGIGWAGNRAESARDNHGDFTTQHHTQWTHNVTWTMMGGFIYNWSRHWGLGVEARYADLGDVEVGPFEEGDKIEAQYTSLFDLVFGLTYVY